MGQTQEVLLGLVRYGIDHSKVFSIPDHIEWQELFELAQRHGVAAIALDGLDKCRTESTNSPDMLPLQVKMEWIGEVLQNYEARYKAYEKAIGSLAQWHNKNGFKVMVLKGYACAMNWPKPEHRPCGDIDIWQFGAQKEADRCLANSAENTVVGSTKVLKSDNIQNQIKIDSSHHHHTVFKWQDFTVENHYDFLNVYHHRSNREMEAMLKELGKDDSNSVKVCGEKVYLPSANLHALFLLRHSMSNFASTGFQLRQLLDWGFFAEKYRKEINWEWLEEQLYRFGMMRLCDVFNAICVGDLGFDEGIFPPFQFDMALKERVLNDIFSPEFTEKETGGLFSRTLFKFRRWKANAWKHELCFNDSMWSAFWYGLWGHLIKPGMI